MSLNKKFLNKTADSSGGGASAGEVLSLASYTGEGTGSSYCGAGNGSCGTTNIGSGNLGGAVDFAHASAHFDIESPISIASNTDYTYSFWLNFGDTLPSTSGFLFGIFGGSTNDVYGPMNLNFYGNSDGTAHSMERYFSGTQYYSDNYTTEAKFTYSANTWYHVALVYTASTTSAQVYHNGSATGSSYVLDTTYGGSLSLSNTHCVGMYNPSYYTSSYGYWGQMDQLRIYDSALSSTEVTALYNETYADSSNLNFPTGKTAKSLYRFDGDITDVSGTYNGSGANQLAFEGNINFTPDLYFVKNTDTASGWIVGDSYRGNYNYVTFNSNNANGSGCATGFPNTPTSCTPAGTPGVGVSTNTIIAIDNSLGWWGTNKSGDTYMAYGFKGSEGVAVSNSVGDVGSSVYANSNGSFSVTGYQSITGASASTYVGVGITPEFAMWKRLDATNDWFCWLDSESKYNPLDGNAFISDSSNWFNGNKVLQNTSASGQYFVVYSFASVAGVSKVGTYDGTGSSQQIVTGFQPSMVIIKSITSNEDWAVFDNVRGEEVMYLNKTDTSSSFSPFSFDSTNTGGFTVPSSSGMTNGSEQKYMYLAFK